LASLGTAQRRRSLGTDIPISMSASARIVTERRRRATWTVGQQQDEECPRSLSFPDLPVLRRMSPSAQDICIDGRSLRDRFAGSGTRNATFGTERQYKRTEPKSPQKMLGDTPIKPLMRSRSRKTVQDRSPPRRQSVFYQQMDGAAGRGRLS
jgi:hypothetical protein